MLRKNETYISKKLPEFTVATAPSPVSLSGKQIFVTDGAQGFPVVAFSDGTNWLRSDTRTPISDS